MIEHEGGVRGRDMTTTQGLSLQLSVGGELTPEEHAAIIGGLLADSRARGVEPSPYTLSVVARDANGSVMGGLLGELNIRWLFVSAIWVRDDHRRRGIGSQLLQKAEEHLRDRGAVGVFLDTFSTEAAAFYESRGYVRFGALEGLPRGSTQVWLAKRLDGGAAPAAGQKASAAGTAADAPNAAPLPRLETARLTLRAFTESDARDVQRLAGQREIADTTLNIPHPYADGMAETWISTHGPAFARREMMTLAITSRETGELLGGISLRLVPQHAHAELGYWIALPFWNRGYVTEAARAVLAHGFDVLGLHRIHASHLTRNPASGRVMAKLGMRHEGTLREHFKKWDRFETLEKWAILEPEWRASC
jgi:[ribosomal protein S5]-alanine N-acetyltransferase